jgi:hypothetical protein
VNFVSFTPGTTFDLKSRSGTMLERALLFRILWASEAFRAQGLLNLLQGPAGYSGWHREVLGWRHPIDPDIAESFINHAKSDAELSRRIHEVSDRFRRFRRSPSDSDNWARYTLIGDLRQRLARTCLDALEPDLVILDEFQRFRNLLQDDDPTAELAQALFNFPEVRVLLLSATPYKMMSLDHEQHDDHYPDFLRTLRFLVGGDDGVAEIQRDIQDFRRGLLQLDAASRGDLGTVRDALRSRLHAVMCRTERVSSSVRQDAMLIEPPRPAQLTPGDLTHARLVDGASLKVGARDALEYWKSTPYAVNLMKGYELRRRMMSLPPDRTAELATLLETHSDCLLKQSHFEDYAAVEPANARLRVLMDDTIERGLWRVLWMPPSLPTWRPAGPFADLTSVTKSLVFSAWNVVPDAIAALCSYEAERRAVTQLARPIRHSELYDRVKPLLRFSQRASRKTARAWRRRRHFAAIRANVGRPAHLTLAREFQSRPHRTRRAQPTATPAHTADTRLTGMTALILQYPSPALAALVDPVTVSLASDAVPELAPILSHVEALVGEALAPLLELNDDPGRADERWYWAALAWLDARRFPGVTSWLARWGDDRDADSEDSETAFRAHVIQLASAAQHLTSLDLGRPPEDLTQVLAKLALGGPGVCALRSLRRCAPDLAWDAAELLGAAASVGAGFRTLFNVPESIATLRGDDSFEHFWLLALDHAIDGNLGALLDEQVHVLVESLGVADAREAKRIAAVSDALRTSLSIRTSQISLDELSPHADLGAIETTDYRLRCRFALRFGEMKDDKGEARREVVRVAFNSPFRPFILASTSVGQEGLDFHLWCHAVVHWNLPSNPVDLEQREGRVQRFKGHAVRKNVALALGRATLRERWQEGTDPWRHLFDAARAARPGDLQTYWLFETHGGAHIERRVPLLPLSRDADHLQRLKRGLALYRLVFGQPRQEDLLAHLSEQLSPEEIEQVVSEWRIDLSPPAVAPAQLSPALVPG